VGIKDIKVRTTRDTLARSSMKSIESIFPERKKRERDLAPRPTSSSKSVGNDGEFCHHRGRKVPQGKKGGKQIWGELASEI